MLHPKDVLPNINLRQAAKRAENAFLLVILTFELTFDLDVQTCPSEGPNTSCVWTWRKCVQRFSRYFMHKQNVTDSAKNRTVRKSLRAVITKTRFGRSPCERFDRKTVNGPGLFSQSGPTSRGVWTLNDIYNANSANWWRTQGRRWAWIINETSVPQQLST